MELAVINTTWCHSFKKNKQFSPSLGWQEETRNVTLFTDVFTVGLQ